MADITPYEQLAEQLATAYSTADAAAIRQINFQYGAAFPWDHDPAKMQQRLPGWYVATKRTFDLALEDARQVVARIHGFASWHTFAGRFRETPQDPRTLRLGINNTPPFFKIDWKKNELHMQGLVGEKEWEYIFSVMKEYQITALHSAVLTDTAMKRLSALSHVTRLNMGSATRLSDEGFRQLAHMPQLQQLELGGWHCPVTDQGLHALRELVNLEKFHLNWAQRVSDAGVAHLSFCEQLQEVNLLGSTTGNGAIAAMAGKAYLHSFKTGSRVTDAGLAMLHQLPVFSTWQHKEMKYSLMSNDPGPNHLLIDGPFTDRGLASLRGLDGLFGLSFFWHSPAFTSEGIGVLSSLTHLGFLGCEGERCDDAAMQQINKLPHLRMLMAQGTVATDDGFVALSESKSIEYIWGRECPNLTGLGFRALATMPALRGLAVSCKQVDMEALATLPYFPAFKELMPMDVTDEGFEFIGQCRQLEALWCMYCRDTTDVATGHLTRLQRLKKYYAGASQITDKSLELLSTLPSLGELRFWNVSGITDAGLAALLRLPNLRSVGLEGLPNITPEGVSKFPDQVQVDYFP